MKINYKLKKLLYYIQIIVIEFNNIIILKTINFHNIYYLNINDNNANNCFFRLQIYRVRVINVAIRVTCKHNT